MVDDTTPIPAQPEPPSAAVEAPKRRLWPYFVGGGILLLMALVIGMGVLLFSLLTAAASPTTAVTQFDRAFAEIDCGLFRKSTTPAFQDAFFGESFTCDMWKENAEGLRVDGTYSYTVVIGETKVSGDEAEVFTTETDSSSSTPIDYDLDYHLVRSNGVWLIDSVDNVDNVDSN